LCGQGNSKDALNPRAQRQHGFAVGTLMNDDYTSRSVTTRFPALA
jgi:hypothetical protein